MDTDNKTEGSEDHKAGVEITAEQVKAEYEAKLAAAEKAAQEYKAKFEEAKTTRDSAKERERKALEERGEYQKVLDELKAEIAEKDSKLANYDTLQAQVEAITEKRRAEILEKLPESKRDKWKDKPLDILEEIVADFADAKPVATFKGGGKTTGTENAKPWAEMTQTEKNAYIEAYGPEALTAKLKAERAK